MHVEELRLARVIVVVLSAVFVLVPAAATAAPTPFTLRFEASHIVDPTLFAGLRHDGRFTASAPFCSAGRAYDVRHLSAEPLEVLRVHTCDDGSGSFTAHMPIVRGEHGGSGAWRIVEGTGRYATLRGLGTYRATLISGDPNIYETITYRTEWRGMVDFDAEAPVVEKFTPTTKKLRRRTRTYELQVGLTARDGGLPLSYAVDVRSGRALLALKRGSTGSGQATVRVRLEPPRRARSVVVLLTVRDALGNETTASRTVGLR